jgi:thioredoxin
MKKGLGLVAGLLFFWGMAFSQSVINTDALKFNSLLKTGNGIILDVRTPQEFSRGHIANATLINISDKDFINKVAVLQKDKPIYIYCLSGSRSWVAADYLAKNGFKQVYNLQQGLIDWQRNNLPLEKSEAVVATNSKIITPTDFTNLITSNKLVFVDFNTVWCAPCKTMNPIVDQLSETFKQKVKVEKIDMDANRELAQALDVQAIPGFLLFKNGQKVWTGKGVLSYEELKKILEKNM